ncbi:MAG TPA: RNA polymerase sigma-54 factor, partial [Phenylobacterium sp.]|nr:RNA polymerase sigma-54 factor [Phenylobacterium sp.]
MALSARLEIRQGQGLVITPQLQQAIKLLQLSNLELDAYVEGELERNPLLQRDERDAEPDVEEAPRIEATDYSTDTVPDSAAASEFDSGSSDAFEDAAPGERATGDAGETMAQQAGGQVDWSRAGRGGSVDLSGEDFESALSREKTLGEHLNDQLSVARLDAADRVVAVALIDAV